MSIVRCLASNDAKRARQLWAHPEFGIQGDSGALLTAGVLSGLAGAVLLVITLGAALIG
jgi:proteasome assembly chaperone (PAC2) family protein